MSLIDTNLLLYAINGDAPEHAVARAFVEDARRGPATFYVTEGIAYEFMRVSTHPRVFPIPLKADDAWGFIDALIRSPGICWVGSTDRHWQVLRQQIAGLHHPSGNLFFDLRTAAVMRENGLRTIYTADADFLQFRDLEVINPLQP